MHMQNNVMSGDMSLLGHLISEYTYSTSKTDQGMISLQYSLFLDYRNSRTHRLSKVQNRISLSQIVINPPASIKN